MSALETRILDVTQVDADLAGDMLRLLDRHYGNVTPEGFRRDLAEKHWVIAFFGGGRLAGFSTQMLLETEYRGERHDAVFSGDTIVDPAHWGSTALFAAFAGLLRDLKAARPERRLFWFLISKGYRTYRMLPLWFRSFLPHPADPGGNLSAWQRGLLDHLARSKFGPAWSPERGILDFRGTGQYLRPSLGAVPEGKALADRHIRFFLEANPGHGRGDELACLAEFSQANLTPAGLRLVASAPPSPVAAAQAG